MYNFQIISKIIFLSVILLTFSCSSINKSSANQNLEVTKVEPLAPISAAVQESDLSTIPIPTAAANLQARKKITYEDIFQERDMSQYDKTDTSKCNSYKCAERQMRVFIWEHWKNKKRGYIAHKVNGIDITFTDHIFIEPNENEEWQISWRVERHQYSGIDEVLIDTVEANSIEQVKTKYGRNSSELVFKDKNGEIIKTL